VIFYELPLGGAYLGHGTTVGINTLAWGVQVPGSARLINAALIFQF